MLFSKNGGIPGLLGAPNPGKASSIEPNFQYSVRPIEVKPSFPPPRPAQRRRRNIL